MNRIGVFGVRSHHRNGPRLHGTSTPIFAILQNGNVGIGTKTASSTLDVNTGASRDIYVAAKGNYNFFWSTRRPRPAVGRESSPNN
jgi:hypothetical protein